MGTECAFEDEITYSSSGDSSILSNHAMFPWMIAHKNAIFQVSKQISEEALDLLYGGNIFKVILNGEGEYDFKNKFTEANRQRMRFLLLVAEPQGISYRPETRPDNTLWSAILPKLRELRIVARQPVDAESGYDIPTLDEDLKRWITWIEPFLRCFGRSLSKETIVSLDVDGQTETRELTANFIPHGFREVTCHIVGDLIFKRGRYSWESGYWDDNDPINSRDGEWDYESD